MICLFFTDHTHSVDCYINIDIDDDYFAENEIIPLRLNSECCANNTCSKSIQTEDTKSTLLMTRTHPHTVQSSFLCTKICCAAEIHPIRKLLESLPGVVDVLVNAPMKTVVTNHDLTVISAQDIVDRLNKGYFGATIKKDGDSADVSSLHDRSQLYVHNICCSSEIPGIKAILVPLAGVSKVSVNVTTKIVYVDHDTGVVSAEELERALEEGLFEAEVRHGGGEDVATPLTAFV